MWAVENMSVIREMRSSAARGLSTKRLHAGVPLHMRKWSGQHCTRGSGVETYKPMRFAEQVDVGEDLAAPLGQYLSMPTAHPSTPCELAVTDGHRQ